MQAATIRGSPVGRTVEYTHTKGSCSIVVQQRIEIDIVELEVRLEPESKSRKGGRRPRSE